MPAASDWPLNRDVIRVAPPLVMPPAEAESYLGAMARIAEVVSSAWQNRGLAPCG